MLENNIHAILRGPANAFAESGGIKGSLCHGARMARFRFPSDRLVASTRATRCLAMLIAATATPAPASDHEHRLFPASSLAV